MAYGGACCSACATGKTCAMGDTSSIAGVTGAPKGTNPALYLRAQLNRFTAAGGAPYAFQYASTPLPLTNTLDADVASRALWVLNMRAGYAAVLAPDPATTELLKTYANAWKNPLAYVTDNLAAVTDVVRLFADAQKIPAATGVPKIVRIPVIGDVSETTLLVGGGLLALLFFSRGR